MKEGKEMKALIKTLTILFIITTLLFSIQSVYAIEQVEHTGIRLSDTTSVGENLGLGNLDDYKETGTTSTQMTAKLGKIFSVVSTAGSILSVIILAGIGIKYMLGSVEEKAVYKKSMVPYLIGVAILFTGSFLPQFIYRLVKLIGW